MQQFQPKENLTILDEKYRELGFQLISLGNGPLALIFNKKVIIAFGHSLELSNEFINKLCENILDRYRKP